MRPTLFRIGPVPVHGYGLMLAVAFLVATYIAARRAEKEGIPSQSIFDLGLLLLISAIVGSRVFHILQHPGSYSSIKDFIGIWQGGLSGLAFYGGFMLAFVVGVIYLRWKKLPIGQVLDIIAPSMILGVGIGRIGCFLAGCCFGKPTSLACGIRFPENSLATIELGHVEKVHPTQLYSFVSLVSIFIFLIIIRRHIKIRGMLFIISLLMYSIHRFLIDFLRYYTPAEKMGALTTSQVMSIAAFVVSVAAIIILVMRQPLRDEAVVEQGSDTKQ